MIDVALRASHRRFRAMGTDGHVVVVGPECVSQAEQATRLINDLESRWSRFRPDSEISRLNASGGAPIVVSEPTRVLVQRAIDGWRLTDGHFDPLVLRPLEALGYDRPFRQINGDGANVVGSVVAGTAATAATDPARVSASGCWELRVDHEAGTVAIPADAGFDPGGIGKGLAADLVTAELMAEGAHGVLVNLGGDVRARGDSPDGRGWTIAVREPALGPDRLATVAISDGAVATSTPLRRRWASPTTGHEAHHLLDPISGRPIEEPADLVSVVAADGWWAEVAATALCHPWSPDLASVAALRVTAGVTTRSGGYERYEVIER